MISFINHKVMPLYRSLQWCQLSYIGELPIVYMTDNSWFCLVGLQPFANILWYVHVLLKSAFFPNITSTNAQTFETVPCCFQKHRFQTHPHIIPPNPTPPHSQPQFPSSFKLLGSLTISIGHSLKRQHVYYRLERQQQTSYCIQV